jgi:colicin import membrane protein
VTPYSQHIGSRQNEPPVNASGSSGSLGAGVLLSVGLHVVLISFIIFGLPIFWQPEQLPGAIGIEFAMQSDITAAPVPQVQGKPKEQPKPEPPKPVAEEKPKKVETPPPPAPPKAAAPPPPPPPEEVAEALPDPQAEKLAEEKKKKEEEKKKKEEEKKKKEAEKKKKEDAKKRQQAEDEQFAQLLDVMNKEAAPEPDRKPEKKPVAAAPSEPVTGEVTENASPVRLTAAQEDGYKRQLIPNWQYDPGIANPENYIVVVRIDLAPDGTVLKADILDKSRMGDPVFRSVAEAARRAPLKLSRFEIPPGEQVPPQIDIVFDLAKAINGSF